MDESRTVLCLCCEKALETTHDTVVYDGGWMVVDFGYGSRFDYDCNTSLRPVSSDSVPEVLACDEIRAYICDDCFEQKANLFEGYRITKVQRRERAV